MQVPLNYNFNGIAHAGETGQPDAPNGFRSISDRALDFTGGVPPLAVFQRFAVVAQPGVLDMVHLGNRNTVDNGNWAFEATADGDNRGTQPAWLPNVNQAGAQTTVLATPIPIGNNSSASVLFHVSNGGGSCSVTFTYQSGASSVHTISAPDWFGGSFAGRENTDLADAGQSLNLVEAIVDLSADVGQTLTQIAFSNRSNTTADYGIYAVNVEAAVLPRLVNRIALDCNWNGVVHAGEDQQPDAPDGFRSIADKALDFRAGVPNTTQLADFDLVAAPGALDCVMLGNRNTVGNGSNAFDLVADGDNFGVQPNWLVDPDLTGPQTTTLPQPILLDGASTASFLFQMTNGGGAFDVTFSLLGGSITATLRGSDWVGGSYLGMSAVDRALPGVPLRIDGASIDLSAAAGMVLTAITFESGSNPDGNIAVLACNVSGCIACPNAGAQTNLGGGAGPLISTDSTGNVGVPVEWTVVGATPSTPFGLFAVSTDTPQAVPLSLVWAACTSTAHVNNPVLLNAAVDALGATSLTLQIPPDNLLCGIPLTAQYFEITLQACPLLLGDALTITLGN
ncbi:MAG: hypothetical protein H6835_07055 [Planctomycetes bacterium]|nr:hypothetical protein [Planctomycetota bacterium]